VFEVDEFEVFVVLAAVVFVVLAAVVVFFIFTAVVVFVSRRFVSYLGSKQCTMLISAAIKKISFLIIFLLFKTIFIVLNIGIK
jgi:hypothetical protein